MANEKPQFSVFTIAIIGGAFVVGLLAGGGIMFAVKGGGVKMSGESGVSIMPVKAKDAGSDWVIKIDDYVITRSEYESGAKEAYKQYKAQYDQLPADQKMKVPVYDEATVKKVYLENLLQQYIVVLKAMGESGFNTAENMLVIKSGLRQLVMQQYLLTKAPNQKTFEPTNDEVNKYYTQNRAQLEATGMPMSQLIEAIKRQLAQQKQQEWLAGFVGQVKENFKVTRNTDVLGSDAVSAPGAGMGLPLK